MACPPLIDRDTFDAVQARLKSRDPRVTPARVTSGPTLLTGICFCAKCGGAMTLRTGRGSAGGTYRYYTCSTKARQGKTGCEGRSIPMDKLDDLVAHHLEDRLLQPERLETVLASVLDRRQERTERRCEHLAELHKRIAETDRQHVAVLRSDTIRRRRERPPAREERIARIRAATAGRAVAAPGRDREIRTPDRPQHVVVVGDPITDDMDQRLNRLYDAIETGVADLDESLKERIAGLKAIREQAANDAARTEAALDNAGNQAISVDRVKTFARVARERIRLAGSGYRREHLRALAQRIEVADKEVRIMGSKSELLRTLVAASGERSAAIGVHLRILRL